MSTGQPIDIDDADLPGMLSRFRSLCASHSDFRHALDSEHSISYRFDMPFVFGYNRARTHFYGDRFLPHVAKFRLVDGTSKSFHIIRFALRHEMVESALQSILRIPHERAHHMATAAEYDEVHRAGIDLDSYRKWFAKWIRATEIRDSDSRSLRIPPDFDTTPLEADHSPEGKLLLKKVRDAMSRNGRSARNWAFQQRQPEARKDSI